MKLHPELRDKRQAHGKMAQVEVIEDEDDLEEDLAAAIFNSVLQGQKASAFMVAVPKDETFEEQVLQESSVLNLEDSEIITIEEFEQITIEEMDMLDMNEDSVSTALEPQDPRLAWLQAEQVELRHHITHGVWATCKKIADTPRVCAEITQDLELSKEDREQGTAGQQQSNATVPLISRLSDPQIIDLGASNMHEDSEHWDVANAFISVPILPESIVYPSPPRSLIPNSELSKGEPAGAAANEPLISILLDPQILDLGRNNLGD